LTKVAKKTKEQKGAMIKEACSPVVHVLCAHYRVLQLQENSEKWKYCWLFQVGAMRNTHLKTVRKLWKEQVLPYFFLQPLTFTHLSTARIFFGRSAVMAKALGATPEEEHKLGIHKLAKVRARLFSRSTFFF
jgi:mRNA turnover protein 4